ncbi:MAG: sigma-70 family RNA polymerase sigma factor [Bdellovibrionaceae bacterium]|nr:sigma-70 family RNA polymerase sigma factor [Pseudobdellovibrionaceae bacterium]
MSEDSELLLRIVANDDRKAFEEILRKYQSPIRAFFRKMCGGDGELANDLAQETFLKAYRGIAGFNGQSQLLTWLFAIAKNVYYEHLRRGEKFEELAEDKTASTTPTDSHLDIAKCMLLLSPEERMVLTLSYTEGLSQTEVADLLDMPLGTVKTHALRAKDKLKVLLQPYKERLV